MFVIGKIPRKFKNFFGSVEHLFEKRQWPHFSTLVLVFAMAHGRRNIHHLNRFLEDQAHRQRHHDFLVQSPWDGAEVVRTHARFVLNSMKPKQGELRVLSVRLRNPASARQRGGAGGARPVPAACSGSERPSRDMIVRGQPGLREFRSRSAGGFIWSTAYPAVGGGR